MYRILLLCCFSFAFLAPFCPLAAKEAEHTLKDTEICLYYTAQNEQKFALKENLLSTISLVETGRYNPDHPLGVNPWPWTVASSKGSTYHKNKKEALADIKNLQAQGIKSIDVGCMQINLKFHGDAFANVEEALEPAKNTAYAASYLKRLYGSTGSWGKAATAYHSGSPDKALKYEEKLISAWRRLNQYTKNNEPAKISEPQIFAKAKTSGKVKVAQVESTKYEDNQNDAKVFASEWRAKKMREYLKRKQLANGVITSDL